jgi:hypothetical protein
MATPWFGDLFKESALSKNRSSFLKRDREARKNEKRAMKRQRREDRKRDIESQVSADGIPAEQGENEASAETSDAPVSTTEAPPRG